MNMYLRALANAMNPDRPAYGWIIDIDHLERKENPVHSVHEPMGDEGTMGPSDVPDDLIARLNAGEGSTFKMYDDDQILYYTGRGLSAGDAWDEGACFGPLEDFGMPNAGAVWIKWSGHPERDNG